MGNSGGDNRVEFGTRITHAIWYESPKFGGGFQFNVLFAPGQNRSNISDNLASGESDCAGNNDPNSGANPLASCSDGAYSNVVSADLSYTNGPLYITGAYEFHQNVNRSSDVAGVVLHRHSVCKLRSAAVRRLASNSALTTLRTKMQ